MDVIQMLLNLVALPFTLFSLCFILPPFYFFKSFLSLFYSLFSEAVAGKVVLITGASSGIGEHLAYEYARRGACLALVARRENRLRQVAAKAELLGSPAAIVVPGDVSKIEDCQQFVEAAAKHFGRLDHVATNAGVAPLTMVEDIPDITNLAPSMLKTSNGKIVVIASCASWLPAARLSFYNASKAALVAMYETLQIELKRDIRITIVCPGLIESEMTTGKFLNQQGQLEVDQEMRDVEISVMPLESTEKCAKAIVKAVCRGEKYLTEPGWYPAIFYFKVFWPEIIEWSNRFFLIPARGKSQRDTISKKTVDFVNKVKGSLAPSVSAVEFSELNDSFLHTE